LDQLQRVIAVLGTPEPESTPYKIEENTLKFIKSLPQRAPTKWETLFPKANPLGLDLLEKMLCYNPTVRFTVEQCLKHPYFDNMNKENTLIRCNDVFDWSFDNMELKTSVLQKAIYNEALEFQI
jgi:serine/threonine protein kinase